MQIKILGIGLLLCACGGCWDPCGNDEVVRVPSSDGRLEAVIFRRDCGATTDFSTQISILTKGASLPNAGVNIFVADSNHGTAPVARWGGPSVDVSWSMNRRLTVIIDPAARILRNESAVAVSNGDA